MSTILKALKKAEDGRAKETLPGKITVEEAPEGCGRPRSGFRLIAAVILPALLAAAVYMNYRPIAALLRASSPLSPPATPSPAPVMTPPPAARSAEEEPPLRLSGIIWDRENPIALVNGKSLSPGDVLSGARVVKITLESVTFRRGGKEFTVRVHE